MVMRAEQREVLEARVAAVGPMVDVMRVDEARAAAARERAAAIARPERAPERRRHRALLAADVERRAALVLDDRDQAAVAREAPDGLDRQIRPARSLRGGLSRRHARRLDSDRRRGHAIALASLARRRGCAARCARPAALGDTPSRSRRAHRPAAPASRPPRGTRALSIRRELDAARHLSAATALSSARR